MASLRRAAVSSDWKTGVHRTQLGAMRGAIVCGVALALCLAATPAMAQTPMVRSAFRADQALTFLILAMGPIPLIPAFAALTAGRDGAFKRRLAFAGVGVAAAGVFVAASTGVGALHGWGVSAPALALAIGVILLLVALRTVLSIYAPHSETAHARDTAALPSVKELAFSPLAFPTIIPPFGVGIVVLLLTLAQERGATQTLAVLIAVVLALDLIAMLIADFVMRAPFIKYVLLIAGAVMGVLQVALALDAITDAIRALYFTS